MKSSASSSATGTPPPPYAPTETTAARPGRSGFALVGRSRTLDPRTHAVRPDIADVRLADRVFAPHYAAPLRRTVAAATSLREARASGSAVLTELPQGAAFDLLDLTGGVAWGIAVDSGLVGYLDAQLVEAS